MGPQVSCRALESMHVKEIDFLMKCPDNIRHVSVLGAGGYQKLSLGRLLAQQSTPPAEEETRDAKKEDGRTPIKPIMVSLCATLEEPAFQGITTKANRDGFLVNLLDPSNCPDFPGAAALSLRMTDGAVVVVDSLSPISSHTEDLLYTAFKERNKVVVMLDNLDYSIHQLRTPKEELYQNLLRTVEAVNRAIKKSAIKGNRDPVDCIKGTVSFSSIDHEWAFNLPQVAAVYAKKFGLHKETVARRLWGDNYFDPVTKKWHTTPYQGGKKLERSFAQFILDPIYNIYAVVFQLRPHLKSVLAKLGIELTSEEENLESKALLRAVMRKFLPASGAILQMACVHLPSPVAVQPYSNQLIFDGVMDEALEMAIKTCDPKGSLVVYVSRMVTTTDHNETYAFGRVYSGCISPGMDVFNNSSPRVSGKKRVENTALLTGSLAVSVPAVPAGNLVAISGLGITTHCQYLVSGDKLDRALSIREVHIPFPIVWAGIDTKDPEGLPALTKSLQLLPAYDPYVRHLATETGEHTIYAYDEAHLKETIRCIEQDLACVALKVNGPFSAYRELIRTKSDICMTRSPNERIRLYAKASPISRELADDVEKLAFADGNFDTPRQRINYVVDCLADKHGWSRQEARRFWAFGHERGGANMLVDDTKAVQYVNVIRDSCAIGFRWATAEGPLCEEPMRSVQLSIMDATMNCDAIFRGGGQIIPTIRRLTYASVLRSSPFLAEPVLHVEVKVPGQLVYDVRRIVEERQGSGFSVDGRRPYSHIVSFYLPATQSLGFADAIQSVSGNVASCNMSFDHWEELKGDSDATVAKLRKVKGLSPTPKSWDFYCNPP